MDPDVVIVGGGPVGTGLAIDLALHGLSVTVVERREAIQQIPKGQNLTPRTGEHFRRWGVTDAIRAASPIPKSYGSGGIATYGTFLSDYHYEWFNRARIVDYYAATNERLPQYETEAVLRRRAGDFANIKLLTGWSFESLRQDASSVEVTITQKETAELRTLSAQYLVGCDGARSPVREAAGITQDIDPHDRKMALLVFNSQELDERLAIYGDKTIYNAMSPEMDGYWQFLGRVDLNGNWFFHAPVPQGATRDNFDFRALLHRAVGAVVDMEFSYVGFWDLRLSLADTYANGRVFIAGDAAHSHPPYGGYGINTGFEDARNLAWKMAACKAGWGGEGLLDSYGEERRPVFASTRDDFILRSILDDRDFVSKHHPGRDRHDFQAAWERRAGGGDGMVTQYLPHYEGSPIVDGVCGARSGATGTHGYRVVAGHHLAPASLSDGSCIYDHLGQIMSVILTGDAGRKAAEWRQASEATGIPLNVIALSSTAETDRWEAETILVRPDEHAAAVGNASLSQQAPEMLRMAAGQRKA
jgi:2-polyprenyl-6-methoxyphenol hydroxylase-like FAD-dependent oxidoreductase